MVEPLYNPYLFGHEQAEVQFLEALQQNRMPHAWMIGGVRGIGKATLAYRIARFLMAGAPMPQDEGPGLFGDATPATPSLQLEPEHPIFSRMMSQSLLDLMIISSDAGEDGEREITVDEIRKVQQFFTLSAAEAGWRVIVIDGAEAMNRNAQNALLKILEEPPAQALILLTCNNAGRMLPTIRSRCRVLKLAPLSETNMQKVMDTLLPAHEHNAEAIKLADGSPGLAIQLADTDTGNLQDILAKAFTIFEGGKPPAIGEIADRLTKRGEERFWHPTVFLLRQHIAERLREPGTSEKWLELWEKSAHLLAHTEGLNMDKKAALMEFFTP